MTIQQRYEDIVERSGLSEDIVRRVLRAETESTIDSLKKGENVTLPGRCILRPELRDKGYIIRGNMGVKKVIKVFCSPTSALKNTLEECSKFEESEEDNLEEDNKISMRVSQVSALV